MAIQIFQSERDAGLEEKLLATAAIAYLIPVKNQAPEDESRVAVGMKQFAKATNLAQPDLHYLSTVLASTGWNNNDDVFDIIETYMARHTPEDKPFNLEHDCANIIGHITSGSIFDVDMKEITEEITDFDKLPSKFHVVTGAVLYKVWPKPELQERMDTLLEEIAKGEWCVSMEALFAGFDYAMKDAAGGTRVIARNNQTAFLTKYLRAYGGAGKYGEFTVGRVLRNIVFCGKGLTRRPANPESLILDDTTIFDGRTSAQEIPEKFEEKILVPETLVYSGIAHGSGIENLESEQNMKTIEQLTADVTERDATIASLNATVAANSKTCETAQAALAAATTKLTKLEQDAVATATDKVAVEAELKTAKAEAEASKASLATASTELNTLKAQAKRTERLSIASTKLSANEVDAAKIVDSVVSLDDAAFASHIEFMATTIASRTPAPKAEQSVEEDPAAKNIPSLETAVAAEKGADVLPPETNQVEVVRASISEYLTKSRKAK